LGDITIVTTNKKPKTTPDQVDKVTQLINEYNNEMDPSIKMVITNFAILKKRIKSTSMLHHVKDLINQMLENPSDDTKIRNINNIFATINTYHRPKPDLHTNDEDVIPGEMPDEANVQEHEDTLECLILELLFFIAGAGELELENAPPWLTHPDDY